MISLIIPVFNESESLNQLFINIDTALKDIHDIEIILVDDGSKDNSYEILLGKAKSDQHYKIIHLARNVGQTAAIQAGIDFANGDLLIFMDSDLQNDPSDIPVLINKINEGYDVVSGWRKDRKDNQLKRNLPSHIANFIISRMSGVHLHDYGCTLKAYKKDVIKDVRLYGEMHRFIPIYASWQGAKVTEIPVKHHAREFGKSKYGLERVFKVILDLFVVKFLDKYLVKPIYVFGGCGLIALFLSMLALLFSFYLKFFKGVSFILTPLPLFSGISFLLGTMCILMGLLAEVLSRTYFESQQRKPYIIQELTNFDK